MPLTRTRSKYYVLSVLGALVLAAGVLAVAPSAQAQNGIEPTIDKECTPNPILVGQQITCTIDLAAPNTFAADVEVLTDTFPAGVRPIRATVQQFSRLGPETPFACTVSGSTVTCPSFSLGEQTQGIVVSATVTIVAIAEQCGTFENTATAEGFRSYTVEDTEEITVEGCEGAAGGGAGGGATPITQEGEQESEAGEIDQSFEVS